MVTKCIMVVDFGTSNVRTNLVSIEDGRILLGYSEPIAYTNVKDDFHEINVDDYWLKSVRTTKKVMENVDSDICILGLIFSYIGDSLVPVDENGNPVYNMIASYDLRAKDDMEIYTKDLRARRFEEITGCPLTPRNTGAKIHWIKKYMPEVKKKTTYYLTLQQYINMKLGLEPISDYSVANRKLMLDVRLKQWSPELMELIDSNEEEQGSKIVGGDCMIGKIINYGDVKFSYEIPVFPGGHDSAVGFIGLGLINTEDILGNVGGTFDHYGFISKEYVNTLQSVGVQSVAGPTSDSYVTIKAHPACKDINWFMREIVCETDFNRVGTFFDNANWVGESNVYYSGKIDVEKGAFYNLGINTGRQQIFDALVEGLTFLSKECIDLFNKLKPENDKFSVIRIGGGTGKSDSWPQLKADVFNCKVERVKNLEVSSVGAAIIACVGLGIYDYEEAIKRMVTIDKTFYPSVRNHERYMEKFLKWNKYNLLF